MIEIWWSPQTTNILTHHPIITSSGWYKICKISNFLHISEARSADLKQTTPAKRWLLALDM